MPKEKTRRNPNNRERDAVVHTCQELAVWLMQLRVLLAENPDFSGDDRTALDHFGKRLRKIDKRARKALAEAGHQPSALPPFVKVPPSHRKKDTKQGHADKNKKSKK